MLFYLNLNFMQYNKHFIIILLLFFQRSVLDCYEYNVTMHKMLMVLKALSSLRKI